MVSEAPGYANMESKVFFVWGCFCFVCIAFVVLLVYETKGLTLEQVDELYGVVSKAWKSRAFRHHVSFQKVEIMGDAKRGMSMQEMAVGS